jgi:hypothetical protein
LHISRAQQHGPIGAGGRRLQEWRRRPEGKRTQFVSGCTGSSEITYGSADLDGSRQHFSTLCRIAAFLQSPLDSGHCSRAVAAGELEQRKTGHRVAAVAAGPTVVLFGFREIAE